MDPSTSQTPQKPIYTQNITTAQSLSATNSVADTVCFVCHLHLSPPRVEISTQAYEANLIVDQKCFRRYPKYSMFRATCGPTDVPLVVLGYFVGFVGQ
jgi:hypothetical protein